MQRSELREQKKLGRCLTGQDASIFGWSSPDNTTFSEIDTFLQLDPMEMLKKRE